MSPRWFLLLGCACGRVGFSALELGDGNPGADGSVDGTGDGGGVADGAGPPNVMFVTSTLQVPGSFGGLTGADEVCRQRAVAGGLDGEYVAYLSTTTVDARDRLAGSRGWVRPDGLPFVDTVADLAAGRLFYPPRVDEMRVELSAGDQPVATGTGADGTSYIVGSLTTCSDYTVASTARAAGGDAHGTTHYFSLWLGVDCDQPSRLYCFGVGRQAVVAPVPADGRLAFLSSPWMPGGGRGDADAHCQLEADGQGLGRAFKALLPLDGVSAADRFDTGAARWVRVDGVPVFDPASDLLIGRLATPLNRLVDGSAVLVVGFPHTWTGNSTPSGAPTTPPCMDWFSNLIGDYTGCGEENFASPIFFSGCGSACNQVQRLYCLEP